MNRTAKTGTKWWLLIASAVVCGTLGAPTPQVRAQAPACKDQLQTCETHRDRAIGQAKAANLAATVCSTKLLACVAQAPPPQPGTTTTVTWTHRVALDALMVLSLYSEELTLEEAKEFSALATNLEQAKITEAKVKLAEPDELPALRRKQEMLDVRSEAARKNIRELTKPEIQAERP